MAKGSKRHVVHRRFILRHVCIYAHIYTLSVFLCVLPFHRDIDKVDDLMAEITEQQELSQEISDVISRPVGFGEDYDEVRI